MQKEALDLPLKDIHLPDAVSWWPLAPGWWLLLFSAITILFIAYIFIQRHQKKWGYRTTALQLINNEYKQWKNREKSSQHENTQQTHQFIESTLTILKRTAISAYPQLNVSSLFGQAWLEFLNQHTKEDYFNDSTKNLFLAYQYQSNSHSTVNSELVENFYSACQQWIKQHKSVSNQAESYTENHVENHAESHVKDHTKNKGAA